MKGKKPLPYNLITKLVILMLFFLLLYTFLVEFKNFLYPIFLGILFAYLLYPVAKVLENWSVPRIPSILLSVIFGIVIVYGTFFFIYSQLRFLLKDLPTLEAQAVKNIDIFFSQVESQFGEISADQQSVLKNTISEFFQASTANLDAILTATAQTAFVVFIMPVYVFFLLYYRNKYRDFILMVLPEKGHQKTDEIIKEVSVVMKKYMGGLFVVVLILCAINALGLYIVGIKYWLLLGLIAAIWNFIPYFGTIIGFSFPLVMALLTGDGPGTAIGVVVLFIIVQFTENNILTPNITGGQVQVNPFFIILGVLVGGLIWGVPGMFIVVPLLATIRIVCEKVEALRPWAFLIGDAGTEKHALTRGKLKRFIRGRK
ncbi:MAG: AI-2E family transporter [Cytophagales bacterium]|nr:AI-2E family transporter [Cytophagales bacterium]